MVEVCDGCNQELRTSRNGIVYCPICGTMQGEQTRYDAPKRVRVRM